jgi:CelD/BcsL family acetyltransferase involved in cellulose biosynthesis
MNAFAPVLESNSPLPDASALGRMVPWRDVDLGFRVQWRELAASAGQANPFYEEWYLLPSLAAFDPAGKVQLFALFADDNAAGQKRLVGLMPLIRTARYGRWPIAHISNWLHPNIFLGEPLIVAGYEQAFWRVLLAQYDKDAGRSLFLHMNRHYADGESAKALRHISALDARPFAVVQSEERAMLSIVGTAPDDYAAAALTGKKRKELRRQANRLSDFGVVTHQKMEGQSAIAGLDAWMADFLALEAMGWKGKAGSALACDPRTMTLFRQALFGAAEAGRLQLLDIRLDETPIAMLANFIAPPAAFSFKTAYDEDYARFSPGVLLQMDNLDLLNRADLKSCDSCAAPDHPMIDSIWRERCTVARMSIGIGGTARRAVFGRLLKAELGRMPTRDENRHIGNPKTEPTP